jgi:hypothetical protein
LPLPTFRFFYFFCFFFILPGFSRISCMFHFLNARVAFGEDFHHGPRDLGDGQQKMDLSRSDFRCVSHSPRIS